MKRLSVPLLKQGRLECGPTALRMVMAYFGKNVASKDVIKGVGGIKRYGVKTIELADFSRELGFKVTCYSSNRKLAKGRAKIKNPDKKDIIKFLDRRMPVIAAVRSHLLYNKRPSKMGHFLVITKYQKGKFWYNDPRDGLQHKIADNVLMGALIDNAKDSSAYLLVLEPTQSSPA